MELCSITIQKVARLVALTGALAMFEQFEKFENAELAKMFHYFAVHVLGTEKGNKLVQGASDSGTLDAMLAVVDNATLPLVAPAIASLSPSAANGAVSVEGAVESNPATAQPITPPSVS